MVSRWHRRSALARVAGNSQARQGGRYATRRGAGHHTPVGVDSCRRARACLCAHARRSLVVVSWDVSSAKTTFDMFLEAALFNASLADWDTARVASVQGM